MTYARGRLVVLIAVLASPAAMACSCAGVGLSDVFGAASQPSEEQMRETARRVALYNASRRIEVHGVLDRAEYFSNQVAELRVSFHNPTSDRLEVWDPAVGAEVYVDGSGNCHCPWTPNVTRWIEPGETIQQVFRTGGLLFQMPQEPGEHKVFFASQVGSPLEPIPFRVLQPMPSLLGIRPVEPGQVRKRGDGILLFGHNLPAGCPEPEVTVGGIRAGIGNSMSDDIYAGIPLQVRPGNAVPVRLLCDGKTIGEFPIAVQ